MMKYSRTQCCQTDDDTVQDESIKNCGRSKFMSQRHGFFFNKHELKKKNDFVCVSKKKLKKKENKII